ncbi:MAG TPA: radical SAM protein, partial [Candidatus Polarisedimenticolia bacterium]|nr:radical SAM protein [Candidatus Polarisedimenticolia bacterium]
EICRLLKREAPQTRLLLGGPEVSYHYQRILEENESVDWICAGEGELTVPELLHHHLRAPQEPPAGVRGMAFRHRGEVGFAPPREFNKELDALPSPFLTGVLGLDELLHSAYFQTTRGCPFTCTYCDYGRNQPYYEFGLGRVDEELRYFQRHRAKALFAVDATFNYRRGRANEILRRVADLGLEAMFAVEVFPSLIDDEMVETLEHVKFAHVGIGIQTANPVAMKNIHRVWAPARIQDKIERLCRMDNVIVSLELIMGLPGDDLATFKQTIDWSFERGPHHIFALPLQILSRTPLEQQVEQFQIVHGGPESGNEILSCFSFSREEVAVGKAMCAWHTLTQPLGFRLMHLLELSPSEFLDRWAHHAYDHGLHDRLPELQRNRVPDDLRDRLLAEFCGFVAGLCRERDRPDLSPMLTELFRYLLLRRSVTREGAFFVDVLDVSCMTTEEKYHRLYSALPQDLPAPDGLDPTRRLLPTGPFLAASFPYDMQEMYPLLEATRMAALPVQETRYVFFQDPDTGAGRAVRVDDFAARFLEHCDGRRSLAEIVTVLDGSSPSPETQGRSLAELFVSFGLLR